MYSMAGRAPGLTRANLTVYLPLGQAPRPSVRSLHHARQDHRRRPLARRRFICTISLLADAAGCEAA